MENNSENKKIWWKDPTLWLAITFILLLAIDQLTKIWADYYFNKVLKDPYGEIIIIPGMIELCIRSNRGIAFSSFANSSMGVKIAIVVGTALLMIGLIVLFFKTDNRRTLLRIALVFIVAGGVGNLIDRIIYRVWDPSSVSSDPFQCDGVRDMVRLKFIFDFGVCNFADFFIVAGAVMLALSMLFFDADAVFPMTKKYKALAEEYKKKEEEKKAQKAAQTAGADAQAVSENAGNTENAQEIETPSEKVKDEERVESEETSAPTDEGNNG